MRAKKKKKKKEEKKNQLDSFVDLEKCCKINEYLVTKIGVDPAENEPSKDLDRAIPS